MLRGDNLGWYKFVAPPAPIATPNVANPSDARCCCSTSPEARRGRQTYPRDRRLLADARCRGPSQPLAKDAREASLLRNRAGLARLASRACLRQRPSAADLDPEPRLHAAAVGGLGGTGRRCAPRRPAAVLRAHRRHDPVPILAPRRRCRSCVGRWSDRRGKIGLGGVHGDAVPALRRRTDIRIRFLGAIRAAAIACGGD